MIHNHHTLGAYQTLTTTFNYIENIGRSGYQFLKCMAEPSQVHLTLQSFG
jgi:hypothetical protein